MLPEGAVGRAGEAAWVWRAAGDVLAKVPVKLGERDARSGQLPVLQGLAAGDRVLRNPGGTLLEGQKFEFSAKPVPAAQPAAASSAPSAPSSSAAT